MKGQIGLEYLLIIGGVLLVALIVGSLLTSAASSVYKSVTTSGGDTFYFNGSSNKIAVWDSSDHLGYANFLTVSGGQLISSTAIIAADFCTTGGKCLSSVSGGGGSTDTRCDAPGTCSQLCIGSKCISSWSEVNATTGGGTTIPDNLDVNSVDANYVSAKKICINGDCVSSWDEGGTPTAYVYIVYSSTAENGKCPKITHIYRLKYSDTFGQYVIDSEVVPPVLSMRGEPAHPLGTKCKAADFTGDGITDIFCYTWGMFKGDGKGYFAKVPCNFGLTPDGTLAMGPNFGICDYDRDGDKDIIVAYIDGSSNTLHFHVNLNNGDGTSFTATGETYLDNQGSGAELYDVSCGDYDGDGDTDVAVAMYDGANYALRIYLNNTGSFSNSNYVTLASKPIRAIASGDIDGDGIDELVVEGTPSFKGLRWYDYEGPSYKENTIDSGIYNLLRDFPTGTGLNLVDGDRDGDLDIFVIENRFTKAYWFKNEGGSSFTKIPLYDRIEEYDIITLAYYEKKM